MMINNDDIIETTFTESAAEKALQNKSQEAAEILENEDKMERFIQRLERKLKVIPKIGDKLAAVPAFFSLIKSYHKKEYTDIPIGTMIAIVSALLYFVSPIDLIPDVLPGLGYVDDALVVAICLKLVNDDVKEYLEWRKANGKNLF